MTQVPAKWPLLILILVGSWLLAVAGYAAMFPRVYGPDKPSCHMAYMNPSYARIKAFNTSYTPLASKYSLYLYREQDRDHVPDPLQGGLASLKGIPALFIPGNAGSFRQIRLIAAQTAQLYDEEYSNDENHQGYDFFALDFNEDFTAFHGRTMWDQAEYANEAIAFILSLYSEHKNPPTQVFILAHSMGGVVSRVLVTLENYSPGSVHSIMTLASPHATLPLTFDGDLLRLYTHTNLFWAEAFNEGPQRNERAHEIVSPIMLISLTGGAQDTMLPADYTAVGHIVPPSNGFMVFTTGIPYVWSPIDHLAIMWCDQLRNQVARALIEVSDPSSSSRTLPLPDRLQVMRQIFLAGFDDGILVQGPIVKVDKGDHLVRNGRLRIPHGAKIPAESVFAISPESPLSFSLLTLANIEKNTESDSLLIFLCNESICTDVYKSKKVVPRSMIDTVSLLESAFEGDHQPFNALTFKLYELEGYEKIVIHSNLESPHFLIAELIPDHDRTIEKSLGLLYTWGGQAKLPAESSLLTTINIPGAWSSLVAYKVHFKFASRTDKDAVFSPFVRQSVPGTHETKWHVNLRDKDDIIHVEMHAVAPYIPFKNNKTEYGLVLELWRDNFDHSAVEVTARVDLFASISLLFLRYRLAIVAGCVLVALLVMVIQMGQFYQTQKYPSFMQGMLALNSPMRLAVIMMVLSLLTPTIQSHAVSVILNMLDPVVWRDRNEAKWLFQNPSYDANSFYLGLEENCLWWLGPLFYAVSLTLVAMTYLIVLAAGVITRYLSRWACRMVPANFTAVSRSSSPVGRLPSPSPAPVSLQNAWQCRRPIALVVLVTLIAVYIPYQLVYGVCAIIQTVTVLKVSMAREVPTSLFNFQVSLLIVMLWVLPVNVPTVIVFMHNVTVNWHTAFSSHHNFLSIVPILWLAERCNTADHLRSFPSKFAMRSLQSWLCVYIAYCVFFGVRHTYWIHHMLNVSACVLVLIFYGAGLKTDHKDLAVSEGS